MATRQYIGARYVIKVYENSQSTNSAEWEPNVHYEPITLVTWQNSSYLSKKDVPTTVGNPASNPEYWVETGYYNGQIASLQSQINNLPIKLSCVTPEMFGAVGDGYTNDTNSFADMFQFVSDNNIGLIICKKGASYKILGELTLPYDVTIDFNHSKIILDNDGSVYTTNFNAPRTAKYTEVLGSNVLKGANVLTVTNTSNIKIGDVITVRGSNLINGERVYYAAGITTIITKIDGNNVYFANTPIFDIENPTLYVYGNHTIKICNIADIEGSAKFVFSLTGMQNAVIENVNVDNLFVETLFGVDRSVNTAFRNCKLNCYKTNLSSNVYPITFTGCTNSLVKNCFIISTWHAISCGGDSPCFFTNVEDCVLEGVGNAYAFGDHSNAFYSRLFNCEVTSAAISNFASIDNCIIKTSKHLATPACVIGFGCNDVLDIDYTIKDVTFDADSSVGRVGFSCGFNPQTSIATTKIHNINIDGIHSNIPAKVMTIANSGISINEISIKNADNLANNFHSDLNNHVARFIIENSNLIFNSNPSTHATQYFRLRDVKATKGGVNIDFPNCELLLENLTITSDTHQVVASCGGGKQTLKNVELVTNSFGNGRLYLGTDAVIIDGCKIPQITYTGTKKAMIKNSLVGGYYQNVILNDAEGSAVSKNITIEADGTMKAVNL